MTQITLKGKAIHTSGALPKIQAQAPDFRLVDQELAERSLKDFKGRRKILYIVPSLDTSVCSLSTKKLSDAIKTHPEVILLLVSADLPFAQKRICGLEKMENITTLSMMRSKDFAKDYGVLIQDGPLMGICARALLVMDENDQVLYTELVPEITQEPDYEKALKVVLKK